MNKIEVKNLSKQFGNIRALDNVNFQLEEHKIYGLLGRNGAGKTTLLNIINNRLFPTEGDVFFNGNSCIENDKALKQFYFISEVNMFPESITVKNMFKVTKNFFPDFDMEYALTLAEQFGLSLKQKAVKLSTGYKSILRNIVALSVNTPYVFFDEPVLGLDANHRELFYKTLIQKYIDKPFTAVISTHLIEEAANLIDHVIIIKHGRIIIDEPKDEFLAKGYMVSGPTTFVDDYIKSKNVIGFDILGGLKTAYILGSHEECNTENLQIAGMDLQKLFIQLSND